MGQCENFGMFVRPSSCLPVYKRPLGHKNTSIDFKVCKNFRSHCMKVGFEYGPNLPNCKNMGFSLITYKYICVFHFSIKVVDIKDEATTEYCFLSCFIFNTFLLLVFP